MRWDAFLCLGSAAAAMWLGSELADDEPLELVAGFAAACWLGGWAAADLWRGR